MRPTGQLGAAALDYAKRPPAAPSGHDLQATAPPSHEILARLERATTPQQPRH